MSHFAAGAEGGTGTIMVPLAAALALVAEFNGTNISLSELEERLESIASLCQVTPGWSWSWPLEDAARRVVMVLLD